MQQSARSSRLYKCRCRSYCTRYNSTSRLYEGQGEWVKAWTRTEHRKADKLMDLEKVLDLNPTDTKFTPSNQVDQIRKELLWLLDLPVLVPGRRLFFFHKPATILIPDIHGPESSHFLRLEENSKVNSAILFTESRCNFLDGLLKQEPPSIERDIVAGMVQDAIKHFGDIKLCEWKQQRGDNIHNLVVNTDANFIKRGPFLKAARVASMVSLVLQYMHNATRRSIRIHLAGVRGLLKASGATLEVIESIPKDPATCLTAFNIDGEFRQYVSCDKCHCLYPYDLSSDELTPLQCTYQHTPTSDVCDAALWTQITLVSGEEKRVPIRKYYHHDVKHWLGRLLCRPGIEDLLDQPRNEPAAPGATIDDIWSSKVFLDLKDANGNPFYPGDNGACRLIFGMSVDGFIPFGSKSQTASSTGIWLVLFNLPVHLRHLPQYLFLVGVIPGPHKPSTHEINHYTQLVVDDFMQLWFPGVYLSRTYKYKIGRQVEALIVPVICDHPGLRQVIGYTSSSNAHYLCTGCDLDLDDIHITDRLQWPMKDPNQIRRFAMMWKNAESEAHQKEVFNAFGWRWSPLFDLPYWDPVRFSIVDSMHALDLNLFNNHIRNLFQIDLKHDGGERYSACSKIAPKAELLPPDDADVTECKELLLKNDEMLLYQLLRFKRHVLYSVCKEYNVTREGSTEIVGNKWVLSLNLHTWRLQLVDPGIIKVPTDENLPGGGDRPDTLMEVLNGKKRKASILVIKHLLKIGTSEEGESRRLSRSGSTRALYHAIIQKLNIDVSLRAKKDTLHEAIIDAITSDNENRASLASELEKATSVQDSGSETDANSATDMETDTETEADVLAGVIPDVIQTDILSPLNELCKPKTHRSGIRVVRNLLTLGAKQKSCREKALASSSVPLYLEICGLLDVEQGSAKTRAQMHDLIVSAIDSDQEKRKLLSSCIPHAEHDAVLGKDVMGVIWKDMANTTLPSWISPPPRDWGTATRGTLSANNWRVISTIHLPISLIWLWRDEQGRKVELLHNFMHLVTAARLACLHVSSSTQVDAYNMHIKRYVDGLHILYPAHGLKPTHHTALHIGDMLRDFGPDHAHNALFYERHIRVLGQINTNKKHSQLEATFVKSAARYSNMCAILEDDQTLRSDMQEMMDTIESIKKEDMGAFRLATILDPTSPDFDIGMTTINFTMDEETIPTFLSLQESQGLDPSLEDLFCLPAVGLGGVRYAPAVLDRLRDSTIIFKSEDGSSEHLTGIIRNIFRQLRRGTHHVYLLVDEYDPAVNQGTLDPYRAFGFAAGYLCSGIPSRRRLIMISQIVTQFIFSRLQDTDDFHALPFNRLMFSYDPDDVEFDHV